MYLSRILWTLLTLLLWAGTAWGSERITVPLTDAPARGPATAAVTIVEFLDFQ
ncbi:MAG: hypothetical protein ACYDAI_16470 [Trichloromonadaceae bacterium]